MPNSNYINGRNAEYLAKALLLKQGYEVVRSAGSKSAIDLVAWNERETRFIQVKKGRGVIRPAEELKLRALVIPPNSSVEVWTRLRGKWQFEFLTHSHTNHPNQIS